MFCLFEITMTLVLLPAFYMDWIIGKVFVSSLATSSLSSFVPLGGILSNTRGHIAVQGLQKSFWNLGKALGGGICLPGSEQLIASSAYLWNRAAACYCEGERQEYSESHSHVRQTGLYSKNAHLCLA